jgi:hypothetical protein
MGVCMKNNLLKKLSIFLGFVFVGSAYASSISELRIDGFGTLAAVKTDNSAVDYINADDDWNLDTDSILGLQLYYPINEKFSLTAQVSAQGKDHYDVEKDTAWLYGTYAFTTESSLRAGRLRIPFFAKSESLEVGYSYHWIRPPTDVYGQLGFTNFDGMDALIYVPVGNMRLLVQPYAGVTSPEQDFQGDMGELDVTNLWGLNMELVSSLITYRLGHTEGDFDINGVAALDGFLGGLEMAGFPQVADKFGIQDRHGKFSGIGVEFDNDDFLIAAEYTKRKTDGLIPDTNGWYTTLGYRFGSVMPHITYSEIETDENYDYVNSQIPLMPLMLAGGSAQFVQMNTSNNDTLILGVRWDVIPKMALKMEWQKMNVDSDSYPLSPLFSVKTASYQPGDDVELFSVAVDFVF